MMQNKLKFRQPIVNKNGNFKDWHYWGNVGPKDWVEAAIQQNGKDTRRESQQYSGYNSSDGYEIYVGDIIKCGKGQAVVTFEEGVIGFGHKSEWLDEWNWPDDASRFKIVGNIIEKPEFFYT